MNDVFEYYTLKIRTLSPVFVGSGKSISKKEFCYIAKQNCIRFMDMEKFIEYIAANDECQSTKGRGKFSRAEKFEQYLLDDKRLGLKEPDNGLKDFMNLIEVPVGKRKEMMIYEIDNASAFDVDHTVTDIQCFMRSKDNRAFIPGSSIKGMLRTVLLQYLIRKCKPSSPQSEFRLSKEAEVAEKELINTLQLKKKNGQPNRDDALNSIMKGLIISDSEPIENENFILCKKMDVNSEGSYNQQNNLNVARECIKPGTEVSFKIKVDKRYFKPARLKESFSELFGNMVRSFDEEYKEMYMSKFKTPDGNKSHFSKQFVILGGGSGYFSKNIIYTLDGYRRALPKVSDFMHKQFKNQNPDDEQIGISPHMLKETKTGGQMFHMGLCEAVLNEGW